jgi:RsiW-degrading membrane proteinase PrsW (M82 family)
MPAGLFDAAVITTVLCAVLGTVFFARAAPREHRRLLALLVLVELPMCWLAFRYVRGGWEATLKGLLSPAAFAQSRTFSAPLTEELAKGFPLLILAALRRREDWPPPVLLGCALGFGFALGEIWTVAKLLSPLPGLDGFPWYYFQGFILERTFVCVNHAAFTATFAVGCRKGHPLIGLLSGMGLHFTGNIAIPLAHLWLPKAAVGSVLMTYEVVFTIWMVVLLHAMHTGTWSPGGAFFGEADCPECGTHYRRPLLGFNLGARRYEPCPHCKHWHYV